MYLRLNKTKPGQDNDLSVISIIFLGIFRNTPARVGHKNCLSSPISSHYFCYYLAQNEEPLYDQTSPQSSTSLRLYFSQNKTNLPALHLVFTLVDVHLNIIQRTKTTRTPLPGKKNSIIIWKSLSKISYMKKERCLGKKSSPNFPIICLPFSP